MWNVTDTKTLFYDFRLAPAVLPNVDYSRAENGATSGGIPPRPHPMVVTLSMVVNTDGTINAGCFWELFWYADAFTIIRQDDSPYLSPGDPLYTATYTAPPGATIMILDLLNLVTPNADNTATVSALINNGGPRSFAQVIG